MSKFSGKCDLYDHISMLKTYPDPENSNRLISNFDECFEIFKKRTNGVIYKNVKVELTKYNVDKFIAIDKLLSKKVNEKGKTIYVYWNKEYKTLKTLNKKGYTATMPIYFNSLYDIAEYLPCTIATGGISKESEYIVIGSSEVEKRMLYALSNADFERIKELSHYREELSDWLVEKAKLEDLSVTLRKKLENKSNDNITVALIENTLLKAVKDYFKTNDGVYLTVDTLGYVYKDKIATNAIIRGRYGIYHSFETGKEKENFEKNFEYIFDNKTNSCPILLALDFTNKILKGGE